MIQCISFLRICVEKLNRYFIFPATQYFSSKFHSVSTWKRNLFLCKSDLFTIFCNSKYTIYLVYEYLPNETHQVTSNNCFGAKNITRRFTKPKRWTGVQKNSNNIIVTQLHLATILLQSCLSIFAWRSVVLRFSIRNNSCEFLASDDDALQSTQI